MGDGLSLQVVAVPANLSVNNMATLLAFSVDEDSPFTNLSNEDLFALIPPHFGDVTVVFVNKKHFQK